MKTRLVWPVLLCSFLSTSSGAIHAEAAMKTPGALLAEIEGLRAKKPAWREIAWRTCLLEGVRESRETRKPLILWIFIDRPIDDSRC
jgi:hypothetical protein